jgi:hypothetical protein
MFSPNLSDAGIPNQSPFLSGLGQGADTYTQLLNAFAIPQMKKMQQQQMQADLQAKQLANQFYTPDIQSQINQRQMQTELMPVNTAVSLQNSLNSLNMDKRMQQQRGWAWTLNRQLQTLPPAARDAWIADNSELYNRMLNETVGQLTNPSQQNSNMNVLTPEFLQSHGFSIGQQQPGAQQPTFPTQQPNAQQLSPQQIQALKQSFQGGSVPVPETDENGNIIEPQQMPTQGSASLMPASQASQFNPAALQQQGQKSQMPEWINPDTGDPQIVVGGQQPQFTPDQRSKMLSMMAANKAATTPQAQNRLSGAVALSSFMYSPEVQNELNILSKYQSMLGKSEAYVKSKLSPGEMVEYNNAKNRLPLILGGGMKLLEGLPTSELGLESGGKFINISSNQDAWHQDPDAATKDWLAAYRLADAEERSIAQTAQPVYQVYKFPEKPPDIIEGALSNKNKVGDAFTNQINGSNIQRIGGSKAIQGSDGKWYTRDANGRLTVVSGGQ